MAEKGFLKQDCKSINKKILKDISRVHILGGNCLLMWSGADGILFDLLSPLRTV